MTRRRSALLASAFACLALAGLIVAGLLHAPLPSRDRGQLAQAVANYQSHSGSAGDRMSSNPAQAATVSSTTVSWYNAQGQEFTTPIASEAAVEQLFDTGRYYNYTEASVALTTILAGSLGGLFTLIAVVVLLVFLRKHMPGNQMRNPARELTGEQTTLTFADVAGCGEAVEELREVVEILSHPDRFTAIGARTPRGVILAGPPGTGKTLLAKAVAGEAGVPFFAVSGSEFVEMFVGVRAARIRDLFKQARMRAPAIIFIDEIDALGKRRSVNSGHGNEEREQTLNQLLVELDGIIGTEPIVVMAATNRVDTLDAALLRPGRFDRHILVDLPDLVGRRAILDVHSRNRPLATDVDLGVIARETTGFSGADLANLLNEGALLAARRDATTISTLDLESATLRVIAGPERHNRLLSDREREIIAYHEMGHALVGHTLPNADPVHKVSIVSRGRALGFTMQMPDRDRVLWSRSQFTDKLAGLLGGRAAEHLLLGPDEITSGAADDLEKASSIATQMVTELGMSPLGLRAFTHSDAGEARPWSEATAEAIDAEIERLLGEAWDRAIEVLGQRREVLDALAARLLAVETIEAAELAQIIDRFPRRAVRGATVIELPARHTRRAAITAPTAVAAALPAPRYRVGLLKRTTMAFQRLAGGPTARG